MTLEPYLRTRLKEKEILLMAHVVIGYPSIENCFQLIKVMIEAGVDLVELQIPFSEPIADGPVILKANQKALENGTTVQTCLNFAHEVIKSFDIPFLFMTYYNIPFTFGVEHFVAAMAQRNLKGAIIPDLPPEEGQGYLEAMRSYELSHIFIFSPTTPYSRMEYIAASASGFIYCVARKGVTGSITSFSGELSEYLARCRGATSLPLAVGFGVKEKADVDYLKGKAEIAVIGTQTIKVAEEMGVASVGRFLENLR